MHRGKPRQLQWNIVQDYFRRLTSALYRVPDLGRDTYSMKGENFSLGTVRMVTESIFGIYFQV